MRSSQVAKRLLLPLLAVFFLGCGPSETPTYRFVQTWGQRGDEPGEMREPVGIAVSGDEIFVTGPGQFDAPTSATVDAEGRIYVAYVLR